jgi:hypothetical protein
VFKNISCSLKLLFSIYILFKFNIAQAPSNEIHVHYKDRTITFRRSILEEYEISNVEDLIESLLKLKLRKNIENVYEKVIILRRGQNEDLNSETLISELYNTKDSAFEVVINGKHYI